MTGESSGDVSCSVIILAFVKTEVTPRKQENATISDRSPLLTKSPSSLEGSLQNRMVNIHLDHYPVSRFSSAPELK